MDRISDGADAVQSKVSEIPIMPSLETCRRADVTDWSPHERGIFGFDSIDVRSRSFNLIRAKLVQFHQRSDWRTFGIVSATPHVGKSFIAANIAAALSRDPRFTTYLLDMDLRRASLTNLLGVSGNPGLREYFECAPEISEPIAYSFADERLIFLPTSPGNVHSAELLASPRAQGLFNFMRHSGKSNIFLVDLPPVFANDDANNCISEMDAYIFVAEEGKTTQSQIKEAVAMAGRDRLVGVILNKYRGGVVSEGYGTEGYYAAGYGQINKD